MNHFSLPLRASHTKHPACCHPNTWYRSTCVTHWILQWLSQQGEEQQTLPRDIEGVLSWTTWCASALTTFERSAWGRGHKLLWTPPTPSLQRYNLHRQRYRNKQPLKSKSLVPGTDNKSSGRQSDRVIRQNIVTSGNWLQSSLATWRRWPGFPPGWASLWVLLVLVFAPAVPLPCMGHSAQAPPNS